MSTYTNCSIELIGTGEQDGTWGLTTNDNLSAIEQLVVGQATLPTTSFSSNQATLTFVASNELQNARAYSINVTATLTGAGTLIVPNVPKTYVIHNNSVGGFSLRLSIFGLSPSNVYVYPGQSLAIYCSGTVIAPIGAVTPVFTIPASAPSLATSHAMTFEHKIGRAHV